MEEKFVALAIAIGEINKYKTKEKIRDSHKWSVIG